MPLAIQSSQAEVHLGKSVRFTVNDSSATLSLDASVPSDVGVLEPDGTFTASSTKPSDNVVTVRATNPATGETATAKVELVIPWPEGWPYLSDELHPWDEPVRSWVARILYDVLSNLPPELQRELRPWPIRRATGLGPDVGARYYYHLTSDFIDLPEEGALDFLDREPDPKPASLPKKSRPYEYLEKYPPSSNDYRGLGDMLLHELAHAVMSERCGGHPKRIGDIAGLIGAVISAIGTQLAGIGSFFVWPLVPAGIVLGFMGSKVDEHRARDFMSEYSEDTDWVMNDWSATKVPLLGLILPWLRTQPPNYIAATMSPWLLNMRNTKLVDQHDALGLLPAAQMTQQLSAAGMPSLYAAASPQEDFADSLMFALVGKSHIVHTERPGDLGTLGGKRLTFFTDEGLLPKGWQPPAPAVPPALPKRRYDVDHLQAPRSTWWKVDPKPPEGTSTASTEAVKARAAHARDMEGVRQLLADWKEGPGRHVERNRDILQVILPPTETPTAVTLARNAELHGDGLRRYAETEAAPHPAAEGDLLLGGDATVWMVTHVDARGRVTAATGRVATEPGLAEKDLTVPKEQLVYHWPPTVEPRFFASGDTASPAYADVNATLRTLIRLWGEEEVPGAKEERSLRSMGGFLRELVTTAGLADASRALQGTEDLHGVLAYLDTHGEGLRPYVPGTDRVRVGDVLIPFHRNTLAVVTRVSAKGEPVDVLTGGTHAPGRIGEAPAAVKLSHGVDAADFHFIWVPSPQPRSWTRGLEDSMPAVFSDLNAALNHARGHVGLDEVRRGEKTHDFSKHTALQVLLGLMLEKGSTPEARRALGPLCWQAPRSALRNFFYRHAGARGRSGVKPGDLFSWTDDGGVRREGLVLEARPDGAPAKTLALTEQGVLQVSDAPISRAALTEVFTPSLQPRELAGEGGAREFYGASSALAEFVARRDPDKSWEDRTVDGAERTFFYKEPKDLAALVSLKAPAWIRARIVPRASFEGVRVAVDTLGEGVVRYTPGTQLPTGTWCFSDDAFGVLVASTEEGLPAVLLTYADKELSYEPFDAVGPHSFWRPSVTPRRYTDDTNDEAYSDLGAELGRLRLWAHAQAEETFSDNPFFRHDAYLSESKLKPELKALLRRGPSETNDWLAWFMEYGEGVLLGAKPRPGDFLLLADGGRGVTLDSGEMLRVSDRTLVLEPLRRVKFSWRPSARKRALPAV
ncbi:hypothetical protein [Pyxidicoccus xibeiensis]|uniref:hypothetical protein n=1 Tax=Pyxidicoccus xibeiensis TaxID=2906759 RepID=UPI0020A77C85|nr:hypothetical protein [Pyxidicoccus xibeiensis]MCP3139234.1 hypothetical protein [Pyxidicoccus xibeiensis]